MLILRLNKEKQENYDKSCDCANGNCYLHVRPRGLSLQRAVIIFHQSIFTESLVSNQMHGSEEK